MHRRQCRLLLSIALLFVAGCSTHADRLWLVRNDFFSGDLDRTEATIARHLEKNGKDADVMKLNRAMVELVSGRPQAAEQTLRDVRDRFDHLEQKSAGEFALSFLTDDQQIAYAGEDYEKVLIRAFLALSNLMGDGGDAAAYSLQTIDKQNQIIAAGADKEGNNPKLAYKKVALGAYVHGLLREATHTDFDDAQRSIQLVVNWEPGFRYGPQDLQRAQSGRHSEPGNGVLYVFALVGRGPYKQESMEIPTTAALLIADRILSHNTKHTLPPTVAPIKVPKVVAWANKVSNVHVSVDGEHYGTTETVTDIGELAVKQYEAVYPQVLARAIARRVVKKGVVYAGKEVAGGIDNPWMNLLVDAVGVAWEAAEAPDTRCWGLLPDKIQVLRLELPAGEHNVSLRPGTHHGPLGGAYTARVTIEDGRNSYLLANFPDTRLVGRIVTNGDANTSGHE